MWNTLEIVYVYSITFTLLLFVVYVMWIPMKSKLINRYISLIRWLMSAIFKKYKFFFGKSFYRLVQELNRLSTMAKRCRVLTNYLCLCISWQFAKWFVWSFHMTNLHIQKSIRIEWLEFRRSKLDYKDLSYPKKNVKFDRKMQYVCTCVLTVFSSWEPSQPAKTLKINTGGVSFCWIVIQLTMPFSPKCTPPHCFFYNFAGWMCST